MVPVVVEKATWQARKQAHHERVDHLTSAYQERLRRGQKHAIEDFLYQYYNLKVRHLRPWHPGAGSVVADFDAAAWGRWYTCGTVAGQPAVWLDTGSFLADRGKDVRFIHELLSHVQARPMRLSCFGLHEWAMVYRAQEHRHPLPLRLGQAGTDEVVENHPLRCTHFDAFRFFTPAAAPLNAQLSRENVVANEQPGCLHVGMDTLKWALKLGPAIPGELLLDAFELARDIRILDMQASPYDVSEYGYEAVAIENAAGKVQYVAAQRDFADRAGRLRAGILEITGSLLGGT